MEYSYFNRDVSWLSFNYRVLLESEDSNLPIYERIKFLSIHASNLEEFYKIRVAEHRSVIMEKVHSDEDPAEAEKTLEQIKIEVTRQQKEFFRILNNEILPELARKNIILHMNNELQPEHQEFVENYFMEEIFPFLQPVMLMKDEVRIFIRDNRLYQVVQLRKKKTDEIFYAIIKIPYAKVPRFIELPPLYGKYYFMFVEDVISINLPEVFVGYTVEGSYNIKISRDADIYIDEEKPVTNIVETIKTKVKKRKIGDLSRFVYDRRMPPACLDYVCKTFHIFKEDLIPDNVHLNMEDLIKLPNPSGKELERIPPVPIRIPELDKADWVFPIIRKKDIFLHYPYHTFDYFIRFLMEASTNPRVEEIMVTQYRVAQDSEIITNLINAAKNGKKVTVFVELKARFDEENNLYTAEMMQQAGIRILYSLPGLKVHAKVALVKEKPAMRKPGKSYAYLSTGNFNEKTARLYSDMAIFTSNSKLTKEISQLFDVLKGQNQTIQFDHLLVTQFNMLPSLKTYIHREIQHAKAGEKTHIILKMNGLQDYAMIDELYKASEAGVKIDLIVRGISCLVPNQPYSRNIRITRIVDIFLEHSRIWYFYNKGKEDLFLSSADWMKRNLYRRIEVAFPILDKKIKQTILDILKIQLNDNVKACFIDEHLNNLFKKEHSFDPVHAQRDIYKRLAINGETGKRRMADGKL
ncbi:MAG: polyphosphate kinase 1 [Dysgonamonadaceae bacterium]|jgi:polyphosphate kinase|nr:polyphosphate kinase 1 [Dysgonamonadaceae bacterium]